MVRDSRIKEYNFSETIDATSTESFFSRSLNGEILEVDWNYGVGAGSLSLSTSGTGEEIWRRNAASGTSVQVARPFALSEISTGSIAGANLVPIVVNTPLILNTGSILSGTSPLTVNIRYR